MGDGHHGWAAAEVVLFLRDCFLRERGGGIELFAGATTRLMKKGRNLKIVNAHTAFGKLNVFLQFQTENSFSISFGTQFFPRSLPVSIDVHLPWRIRKVSPSSPHHLIGVEILSCGTKIRFAPEVSTALLQIEA